MNIALIGCGPRGIEHLTSLSTIRDRVTISVLCDCDPESLEKASRLAPDAKTGSNLEDLLLAASCDLAVMCLPPFAERSEITEILANNHELKAILVEKPAAIGSENFDRIYGKLGVPVFVCHQMRLLQSMQSLKHWWEQERDWTGYRIELKCFGKLWDQGLHLLDLLYWLEEGKMPRIPTRGVIEDDPARMSQIRKLPPNWRYDRSHPGAQWTEFTTTIRKPTRTGVHDIPVSLRFGPLAFPTTDWLGKGIFISGPGVTVSATAKGGFVCDDEAPSESPEALSAYTGATASLYSEIQKVIDGGSKSDLPCLEEHRKVVEWIEKIRMQKMDRLPVPHYLTAYPIVPDPILSVIIPLSDHRGQALKCIESWTRTQECLPEEFEVVVISNSHTKTLAATLRPLLRSHDKLLHYETEEPIPGQGDMVEYTMGIEACDSEFLFLTEPHCIATPETVREARRFFTDSEAAAFCCAATDFNASKNGKMEELYIKEGFEHFRRAGAWEKMIMRGFGIRRTVYEEVGGLRLRYGRFSEWLLAADLHRAGFYISFEPRVALIHCNTPDKNYLDDAIEEFVIGQAQYLDDVPAAERDAYFPDPPLPEIQSPEEIQLLRRKLGINPSIMDRLGWTTLRKIALNRNIQYFLSSVFLWNDRRCLYHFRSYFESQILRSMLIHRKVPSNTGTEHALSIGDKWTAANELQSRVFGSFQQETFENSDFCWMPPFLGFPIIIPSGESTLKVSCPRILPEVRSAHVATACLDPEIELEIQDELPSEPALVYHIKNSSFSQSATWIGIRTKAIPARAGEARSLGIPVGAIFFETR